MNKYHIVKQKLLDINKDALSLFESAARIPGANLKNLDSWENTCRKIESRISDEILRIAVVGPVKSGKSTFVNSLFKGDYVKRGAGIVTSIVTRIRKGSFLAATLFFKSAKEINDEIKRSMVLFPLGGFSEKHEFDILKEEDRKELAKALDSLSRDILITKDTRNRDGVILSSFLKGYDKVKDIISDKRVVRRFEGDDFHLHKPFTGDDSLAIYLTDIELTINTGEFDKDIEIADCQGSDSPNPHHLVMIQEYLLKTHLIVYVISSRTGLRQADIKFLSIIRKMGILENLIFLINFDFGEHDTMDDVKNFLEKTGEELGLIHENPEIFTFSALFNLFKSGEKELSVKDSLRLAQWKGEKSFADFSDNETKRFQEEINKKLTDERYSLLLKNHMGRLDAIIRGFGHWVALSRDILTKDAFGADEITKGLGHHKKKMERIKSMIKTTLDGGVREITGDLKSHADRFFDTKSGLPARLIKYLNDYSVDFDEYKNHIPENGFSDALYLMFQDVKKAVDAFMAETVNPEVIKFLKEEEKKIKDHFEGIYRPYDSMVKDAIFEYNKTMKTLGIPLLDDKGRANGFISGLSEIAKSSGIEIQVASASIKYSQIIRGEAILHLGAYRILRFMKKLFKRKNKGRSYEDTDALKAGLKRIKKETEKALIFAFKDYRENLKFQYLIKLSKAVSDHLYMTLSERFDNYMTDISLMVEKAREKSVDKKTALENLAMIADKCADIRKKLSDIKEDIAE